MQITLLKFTVYWQCWCPDLVVLLLILSGKANPFYGSSIRWQFGTLTMLEKNSNSLQPAFWKREPSTAFHLVLISKNNKIFLRSLWHWKIFMKNIPGYSWIIESLSQNNVQVDEGGGQLKWKFICSWNLSVMRTCCVKYAMQLQGQNKAAPSKYSMNRAIGSLYGQVIGDALGARYESKSRKKVRAEIAADIKNNPGRKYLPILGGGPFHLYPGRVSYITFRIFTYRQL